MGTVEDQRAIIQVINRYGLAMDSRRWDLFDSIFTADVELDYSGTRWTDLASFKTDFAAAHERFDATQHAMMNHLVELAGEAAAAFTYCSWRLICRRAPSGDFLEGTAWYDDALIRTTAGWRIRRRACRILWAEGNPLATGAREAMPWDVLRLEAAQGKVGYLEAVGAKASGRAGSGLRMAGSERDASISDRKRDG
jgi:hypothetical protein